MELLLLASLLTCNQASWIAQGAANSSVMTTAEKIDVLKEIKRAAAPGCDLSEYFPVDDLGQGWLDEST